MSNPVIFYSWQSDLPNATNRAFLHRVLSDVCKDIANDSDIMESPRLDQDTQGLTGAPEIPQAIMDKIDSCNVFVADVSLSFDGPEGKRSPNPNVMFELGYAVAKVGWGRIVMVVNTHFGDIAQLPFDLDKRRAVPYSAMQGESDRSSARKELSARLRNSVSAILQIPSGQAEATVAQVAIQSIENQHPARRVRIREYWKWVIAELERVEPELQVTVHSAAEKLGLADKLESSLAATSTVSIDWSRLCEIIATLGDRDAAKELINGFNLLMAKADFSDVQSRSYQDHWFDYWKFLGHEFWLIWIGCALNESCWPLIGLSIQSKFDWPIHRERTGKQFAECYDLCSQVDLLHFKGRCRNRASGHADYLRGRYLNLATASSISWGDFLDAEIFMYMASQCASGGNMRWWPWTVFYFKRAPKFLLSAVSINDAGELLSALNAESKECIREALAHRLPTLATEWRMTPWWDNPVTDEMIDAIGSET